MHCCAYLHSFGRYEPKECRQPRYIFVCFEYSPNIAFLIFVFDCKSGNENFSLFEVTRTFKNIEYAIQSPCRKCCCQHLVRKSHKSLQLNDGGARSHNRMLTMSAPLCTSYQNQHALYHKRLALGVWQPHQCPST